MSIAAIIVGLLLWRSVPYFFKHRLSDNGFNALRISCRIVGILIIVAAIVFALF